MKRFIASAILGAMLLSGAGTVAVTAETAGLTLSSNSRLVLDRNTGYVDMIDGTVTVGELKANFSGNVSVAGKSESEPVCTDDAVSAGGDTLKAMIYGDTNRDGAVSTNDAVKMLQYLAKWEPNVNTHAADVDRNGRVNLVDVVKVLRKVAGWEDVSLGNVRMVFENKKLTAPNEDAGMELFFTSVMNKIGRSESYNTGENSYKMKLAKNESESCQALLLSDSNKSGMTASLTDFVHEYGDASLTSKLEWVQYYDTALFTQVLPWDIAEANNTAKDDEFPEVLLPMADSFELSAGKLSHMMITVTSSKDSPAGMYKAALNIKDSAGKTVKSAEVYAYVWDFTLPDAPYSASLFCNASYPTSSTSYDESLSQYFDHLLSMNLSSYILPVEITSSRADAYMSDPRVTAFTIAGYDGIYGGLMGETDSATVANYKKVASNPEWFKKGLFYYTDEPYGAGLYAVRDRYNHLTSLLGTTNVRNMTPFGWSTPDDASNTAGIDSVEFMKPYINVWVPTSHAYHRIAEGGTWTPRRFVSLHGEYADRIETMRQRGDDIWWYVCCAPEAPYANYFTTYQGVIVRLLSWQQYFNDVNGSLYYATSVGWPNISKYQFSIGNGDGTLQYPGEIWGFEGPQSSWRLLQIRDGFDDFDYLRMAEELVGRETVMDVVKKVSSGMLNYTEDYKVLETCRDKIAAMVIEAK